MKSVEEFVEAVKDGRPPMSEMAISYTKAVKKMDANQARLLRYLRVKEGQAVFLDGYKAVVPEIQKADAEVEDVRRDIQEYLGCLGDEYNSATAMTEKLARLKRKRDNVIHDVDALTKQAINRGVDPDRVMEDPTVAASADKRDRVVAEVTPEIESLSRRLKAAQAILGKY